MQIERLRKQKMQRSAKNGKRWWLYALLDALLNKTSDFKCLVDGEEIVFPGILQKENGNIIFSRFSKQERECLSYGKDNSFSTSGVRLEFETDCTYLKISVCNEHSNPHGRNFYSYDIYCNDNMTGQIKNYNVEPSYPYKEYSLDDRHKIFKFPVGIKKICVYFPGSLKGMIK